MISYLNIPSSPDEIYAFLDDTVREWFKTKFPYGFTPPQLYAIPSIHNKRNTLVFSSTGSGKTFAAFLASINELFILAKKGELKDQIYVLYISPLKALGNDIQKNLEEPLQGIQDLAAAKNITIPKIRVEVRTGDTSQAARNRMRKKPPHILITTPESLGLILASPKFSQHLKSIRWLILDEIHELANNKRGAFLSLCLEYLQIELVETELTRIGLSATQAPVEEIARFLVGLNEEGKERDCNIANLPSSRKFDLRTISPVKDLLHTPYVEVQQSIYSILSDLVLDHETSIIFTNTRRGAEGVAFKLKEYLGPDYASKIAVHHSSVSKEIRLDVEDKLKNNELVAAVSSTSLELGIDIGSVELVSQIGSPKSVAKYLQRVGRSGHSLDRIAKGRLIVTDRDDAIECSVLNKAAYANDLDKVQIPENCLDVLAQFIVGISTVKRWNVDEAYQLVRSSYNYRNLDYNDYMDTIKYLGGHYLDLEERKIYRKIWYDAKERAFGRKKNTRIIFYLNIGTIPESADYFVELETYRTRLGVLSESFVERMTPGDVIVLGSHTYQFKRTVGSRVIVSDAFGRRPTIPSWVGEELPRSFELSQQIGRFIKVVASKIENEDVDVKEWIIQSFNTDEIIAETIIEYVKEQLAFLHTVPTHDTILIESFIDPQGRMNIVFHSYCGRRVNDALSRAYAYAIGTKIQSDVASAVNDNGFLLVLPAGKIIDTNIIPDLVKTAKLEQIVKKAIINTELFQLRFRHVANRAFMILRHSGTRRIPVSRQSLYAKRILSTIKDNEDFCVIKETFREIMRDYMDLANSLKILDKLERGEMNFVITSLSDIPSPFAHGIVLLGSTDIIQIADRSALLRELHSMVLSKVFGQEDMKETLFSKSLVDRIFNIRSFKDSSMPITSPRHLQRAIKALSPISTLSSIPPSVYQLSINDPEEIRSWVLELFKRKELIQIPITANTYRTIYITDFPLFWNIYVISSDLEEKDQIILKLLREKGALSAKTISQELNEDTKQTQMRLQKLERAFHITRVDFKVSRGKTVWKYDLIEKLIPSPLIKQAKNLDPEDCLNKLILRYLSIHGPSTTSAISDYFQLKTDKINRSLTELEQQSLILKGQITEHFAGDQYIRIEDRELLRNLTNREQDYLFFSYEELNYINYHYMIHQFQEKNLSGKDDLLDVMDFFGSVENLNSLAIRMKNFDIDDVFKLIEENRIIQGRFSHKRVAYVSHRLFPFYYVAYKEQFELSTMEKVILDTIRKFGPLSKREIVEYTGLEEDIVRESISILDKTLYLCRKPLLHQRMNPQPFVANIYDISSRYVDENKLPSYEKSLEFIVFLLIKAMGPISLLKLTQISGFKYADVENTIKTLLKKGKIVEKPLSATKTNYYMTPERSEDLVELKKKLIYLSLYSTDDIILVPREDPYTKMGLRMHLRDKYGEGDIDPILYNGKAIGSVEYKLHPGQYLQIYDLKLEPDSIYDLTLLQKVASALVDYTRTIHRVLSLQIEDINGKSILSKSNEIIKDIFIKTGYRFVKGALIGGETISRVFPLSLITKFRMSKLYLSPSSPPLSLTSLHKLIEQFGQLTFEEIVSRFPESNPSIVSYLLNKLLEEQVVFYQNGLFYSNEFARFRKGGLRKRRRITEKHEEVHKMIKKGVTSITDLSLNWSGSSQNLRSILNALQENMLISTKRINNFGEAQEFYDISKLFSDVEEKQSNLRNLFLYTIVNSLGLATEEQIVSIAQIPGVLTKIRIKESLASLVNDGTLLSGRFIENSLQIFYITKHNYDALLTFEREYSKTIPYESEKKAQYYILPPNDRAQIALKDDFPEHFEYSTEHYCILINQKLVAQVVVDTSSSKRLIINNLILAPWADSKLIFNYLINAIETLPLFLKGEQDVILIKRINDIPTNSLVI
ncbi:MAG: ATP-dependent helicase [Candidatus Heimdallarchaeaceae archaeon]